MMKTLNPCIRCGKERIDARTWTEEIEMFFGKTKVIHTETVCPDSECQKIVSEKLEASKLKNQTLQQDRIERLKKIQHARKRA